eukprot:5188203-Prymnesium_polylepis.2
MDRMMSGLALVPSVPSMHRIRDFRNSVGTAWRVHGKPWIVASFVPKQHCAMRALASLITS